MSAAYFEDHPIDPDKVIMRKPHHPIKSDKERTWVGLTDEDVSFLLDESDLLDMFENIGWYSAPKNGFKKNGATLIQSIEAKLKQKNGYT